MKKITSGGGWQAIAYTFRKARQVGGFWKLWKAMRSRNACKTCALGMGGQQGGMVNELGHFPEVCKKSLQAMAADMQGAIKPEFWQTYSIDQLRSFSPRELENCGRLVDPVLRERGAAHFRPIGWDEAFERIAGKLRSLAPDETFWYFSGRGSNEAGFLLQLFARALGTNNVNNCSYFCHQASGVGLANVLGTGTATIELADIERADLVFVIGGNPPSNHPRLMTTLKNVRRRGGQVIVINPVVEVGLVNFRVPSDPWSLLFGSKIATLYVQPDIGGDLALLTGIAKRILEMGAIDEPFLRNHTSGWEDLQTALTDLSWSEIIAKSGVSKQQIDQIAERYAAARNVVFSWTMGITHHAHGVENVEAIANLALMRGMVGRPHSGLLPIRGHSNVQGIGSMGVTPALKPAIAEGLSRHFGITLPTAKGRDTLGCLDGALEGTLKFGLCLGGNLFGSAPDSLYARRALERLDMLVYLNTTLNTGHAHGVGAETLILPVLARDEEPQATTQESMFNFVRLSDGGPQRHAGPLAEVAIVSRMAQATLGADGPIDWPKLAETEQIRQAIAAVVPGFQQIGRIGATRGEFHIAGRVLHEPKFPIAGGRARLQLHALPPLAGGGDRLRLMTVRSEGQFNTVVYEDYDLYRGQERRDVILVHPDDIARLGLAADQRVSVTSDASVLHNVLLRPYPDIKPGNVLMYYPEANVLVPRSIDPRSRTPAFKGIAVRLSPTPAEMQVVGIRTSVLESLSGLEHGVAQGRLKSC